MRRLETIDLQEFVLFFRNGGELEFQISRADIGRDDCDEFWNYCPEDYMPFSPGSPIVDLCLIIWFADLFGNILLKTVLKGGRVYVKKILPDSYGVKLVI